MAPLGINRTANIPQQSPNITTAAKMPSQPTVDVNLFVHNGATTVRAAIESVIAQSWPNVALTLIDDGSTDRTPQLLQEYARKYPKVRTKRTRCDSGPNVNFQRACWFGNADFVIPKFGNYTIAPDAIERLMEILLARPNCVMTHAAGPIFRDVHDVLGSFPPEHRLSALGEQSERARHVMIHHTASPSLWGIYRRDAVECLLPIAYRIGCSHLVLVELALCGEIRHVPNQLYWQREGIEQVLCMMHTDAKRPEQACNGLLYSHALADQSWRTPLITTAYMHIQMFAESRLVGTERLSLMRDVPTIYRSRWLPWMYREAEILGIGLPAMSGCIRDAEPTQARLMARSLLTVLHSVAATVTESDQTFERRGLTALAGRSSH